MARPSIFQQIVLPYLAVARVTRAHQYAAVQSGSCTRLFRSTRAPRRAPADTDPSSSTRAADSAYAPEWEYVPPIPRGWKSGHDPPDPAGPPKGSSCGRDEPPETWAQRREVEVLLRGMEDMNETRRRTLIAAMERIAAIQEVHMRVRARGSGTADGEFPEAGSSRDKAQGKGGEVSPTASVKEGPDVRREKSGPKRDADLVPKEDQERGSVSAAPALAIHHRCPPEALRHSDSFEEARVALSDPDDHVLREASNLAIHEQEAVELETGSSAALERKLPVVDIPSHLPLTLHSLLRSRLYRLAVFHLLQTPEYAVDQPLLDDVASVLERAGAGKLARRLLRGWDNAQWGRKAGDPIKSSRQAATDAEGSAQANPLDSAEWDEWLSSRPASAVDPSQRRDLRLPPGAWARSRRSAVRPKSSSTASVSPGTAATDTPSTAQTLAILTANYNAHLSRALFSPKKRSSQVSGSPHPTNPLAPLNTMLTSTSPLPRASAGLHQLSNLLTRIDKLEKSRGFRPDWVTANLVVKCWLAASASDPPGSGGLELMAKRKQVRSASSISNGSGNRPANGQDQMISEDSAEQGRSKELRGMFGFVKGCYERALAQQEAERTAAGATTTTSPESDRASDRRESASASAPSLLIAPTQYGGIGQIKGKGKVSKRTTSPGPVARATGPDTRGAELGGEDTGPDDALSARIAPLDAADKGGSAAAPAGKHGKATAAPPMPIATPSEPASASGAGEVYPYAPRLSFDRHVRPFTHDLVRAFRAAGDMHGMRRVIGWEKEMRARMTGDDWEYNDREAVRRGVKA